MFVLVYSNIVLSYIKSSCMTAIVTMVMIFAFYTIQVHQSTFNAVEVLMGHLCKIKIIFENFPLDHLCKFSHNVH